MSAGLGFQSPTISRKSQCILIIIVASLSFAISLDGDFVFDDSEAIVNNKDIKLTTPLLQVLQNDFWGTNMLHNKSHKSYRPVTVITYKMNLLLSDGELTPFKFKLTNLLLHVIACLFCFTMYEKLLDGSQPKIVFLSAILFAIHPIHTEAVANVVGRAELLCTIFGLLGFLFFCKTRYVENYFTNILWTFISILFVGLSMFSKEQGITIFSICILYDLIIVNRIRIKDIAQFIAINFRSNQHESYQKTKMVELLNISERQFRFLCIRTILIGASGVAFMYLRLKIMGSLPTFQEVDNPASFLENSALKTMNYFYIYSLNAWLLLCPDWLCFDWSMGCVPLITSLSDSRIFAVVLFIFVLSSVCLSVVRFENNKLQRASLLALSIILLTFLPASNLFFRVGFVVAERVLYLPSIGYCLLVSIGFHKLAGHFHQIDRL
ncbi:protein O-mannosyl-transferase TMTC4 isoform X1 [Nilaparvata lugens]|uniref:protein O-mannosyl-transferase TMTC4 isoform X1 n=1 Tax=Nilaparvata lugens TaxID=108931 RepID=UPI00193E0C57|nr:protein O-mannosyl-transferase TMTC4 isoform X1 [Nilaparvata lugens]